MNDSLKSGLLKLAEQVPSLSVLAMIVWLFVGLQTKQMETLRQINDRCMAARVEEREVISQSRAATENFSATLEKQSEAITKLASAVDKMKR